MDWSTVQQLALHCRNWGRWGPNDELGTLNYVTPEKVTRACSLVRRGKQFSLAIPFDSAGPQRGPARFNPIHVMLATGTEVLAGKQHNLPSHLGYADDMVTMPLQAATQWDALSHIFYEGVMYNNRSAGLVTSAGAVANSITPLKNRVMGRGVLLDIARFKGVPWLKPGYPITVDDLEQCAKSQGVTLESGDFLLVRTGQMAMVRHDGSWGAYARGDAPGLSLMTAPWLHKQELAAVASDTWGVEVRPNETPDVFQPWHLIALPNMGLLVGEIFYLEDLAEDCAQDGMFEFLFFAPPLPITGAVASPINPIAVK